MAQVPFNLLVFRFGEAIEPLIQQQFGTGPTQELNVGGQTQLGRVSPLGQFTPITTQQQQPVQKPPKALAG